ncbi:nucleoside-diphosphate sugar epimerase, partial [Vibrio vulnificus]
MDKLAYIWSLPRVHKRLISLAIDTLLITFSFFMAIWVRHGEVAVSVSSETWLTLAGTVVVTLVTFTKLGLYRAVLRYLTFHALTVVVFGALISALSITTFAYFFNAEVPRTVPVIYMTFLALLCGGARMMVRSLIVQASRKGCERVLIYGAGSTGRQLAIALRNAETYQVKGFIDNDPSLENTIIQGLTVHSSQQISRLVEKQEIEKILLAMP